MTGRSAPRHGNSARLAPPPNRKLNYLIIGGLALALVMVVVDSYLLHDNPSRPTAAAEQTAASESPDSDLRSGTSGDGQEDTVAVLPFTNLSSDEEQEYFADGLAIAVPRLTILLSPNPSASISGKTTRL